MTGAIGTAGSGNRRAVLWLLICAALLLLVAANAHLVYVATTSQPDCVDHLRQGEAAGEPGKFTAARSSCSPG